MIDIGEKYLPIGTVVMLKGGTKRIMITGFCSIDEDSDIVYDYTGCIYPEGFLSFSQICLFNHNQIDEIYFKGFVDQEELEFKEELNRLLNSNEEVIDIEEDIADLDDEIVDITDETLDLNKSIEEEIPVIDF